MPTPMVQEPYFTLPVVAGSTVGDTVVTAPADCSPMVTATSSSEPVPQEPNEAVVAHEGEQRRPQNEQPQAEEVPVAEPSGRPQRIRKSSISDDYIVYECEEVSDGG